MEHIKEDGRLDIERIDTLPCEEYRSVMDSLSKEQVKEYLSYNPNVKIHEKIDFTKRKYNVQDLLDRGAMLGEDVLNELRKDINVKK